jgi:hypothetical protein
MVKENDNPNWSLFEVSVEELEMILNSVSSDDEDPLELDNCSRTRRAS